MNNLVRPEKLKDLTGQTAKIVRPMNHDLIELELEDGSRLYIGPDWDSHYDYSIARLFFWLHKPAD